MVATVSYSGNRSLFRGKKLIHIGMSMLKENLLMNWFARSANELNNLGGQEVNHSAAESARLLGNGRNNRRRILFLGIPLQRMLDA